MQVIVVRPDIVALQETGHSRSLTGYHAYSSPTGGKAATLVAKAMTVIQHPTLDADNKHVLTDVVPHKRGKGSVSVRNVYSLPRYKNPDFELLIKGASKAANNSLVILTDSAQHKSWEYVKETSKGNNMAQDI
ncbi:hypothetical protein HPB49_007225 [Dermacentor silvarum]|uniref:Uncharacterized protein n=1 Tax=Dermacentor silvarum TaxID=543639 RepID=A0ACB8DWV1_DERSI|nr:hypothetical protein HPB49_007225 [Dermacentor silvarum]